MHVQLHMNVANMVELYSYFYHRQLLLLDLLPAARVLCGRFWLGLKPIGIMCTLWTVTVQPFDA